MRKANKLLWSTIVFFTVFFSVQFIWEPAFFRVYGPSMWPLVCHGDMCITIGNFTSIERGEVLSFYKGGYYLVKRVIGLPNETIRITKGIVYINGKEEKTVELVLSNSITEQEVFEVTLGPDEYFMMGDNRPNSHDSRAFGPVNRRSIMGKVIMRWRPFNPRAYYGY